MENTPDRRRRDQLLPGIGAACLLRTRRAYSPDARAAHRQPLVRVAAGRARSPAADIPDGGVRDLREMLSGIACQPRNRRLDSIWAECAR